MQKFWLLKRDGYQVTKFPVFSDNFMRAYKRKYEIKMQKERVVEPVSLQIF